MDLTLSQPNVTVQSQHCENSLEKLILKLYALKDKFESMYYGKAECKKYEKARAFTIQLNAALYEANKIQSATDSFLNALPPSQMNKAEIYIKNTRKIAETTPKQIKAKIKKLDKELNELIY